MKKLFLLTIASCCAIIAVPFSPHAQTTDDVSSIADTLFQQTSTAVAALCTPNDADCLSSKMKSVVTILTQKAWALNQVSCPPIDIRCIPGTHLQPSTLRDANGCPYYGQCMPNFPISIRN